MELFCCGFPVHKVWPGLKRAFGHLSDPSKINDYALVAGLFGVECVMADFAGPVLDSMPLNRQVYQTFFDRFELFANALAVKIERHVSSLLSYSTGIP